MLTSVEVSCSGPFLDIGRQLVVCILNMLSMLRVWALLEEADQSRERLCGNTILPVPHNLTILSLPCFLSSDALSGTEWLPVQHRGHPLKHRLMPLCNSSGHSKKHYDNLEINLFVALNLVFFEH